MMVFIGISDIELAEFMELHNEFRLHGASGRYISIDSLVASNKGNLSEHEKSACTTLSRYNRYIDLKIKYAGIFFEACI